MYTSSDRIDRATAKRYLQWRMWQKVLSRDGVDITTLAQVDEVFYELVDEALGKKHETFFTVLNGRQFTHFIDGDIQEVGRFAYRRYFDSPERLLTYYHDGQLLLQKTGKQTSDWSSRFRTESSPATLLAAFQNFRAGYEVISRTYSIQSWFAIEAWQMDYEALLHELMRKRHLEHRASEILHAANRPWKSTAINEIQEKISAGIPTAHIVDAYQFLRSWSVIWYRPLEASWVQSIAPKEKPLDAGLTAPELFVLLQPDEQQRKFFDLAPYMVFFKDWRDDVRRMHAYQWSFLFDAIAASWNVARDDLGYLTLNEIASVLSAGVVPFEAIVQRKQHCVLTRLDPKGHVQVVTGPGEDAYINISNEIAQRAVDTVVKGKIAQPGIARGIVRLIARHEDIARVQEGEILVANTTHPDYLPAMQKAAAFVTNEGGIISHAAIVARELKKPCIVGAKNATVVLRDGDMVEVDAHNGIVRAL